MHRLLLCDDASDYRALLRVVLGEQDDFVVAGEATDGRDLLRRIGDIAPDVVLLDMDMPGMGGMEALPQLLAQAPGAVVVVLSTVRSPELEAEARALGAAGYIEKPRQILRLPAMIREALAAGAGHAPGALVERMLRLWVAGEHASSLALFHEHVEIQTLRSGDFHGLDELSRAVAEIPADGHARVVPVKLMERDDRVLVLAKAEVDEECLAVGWVYDVEGDRIAYVKTYGDWSEAKAAAGMTEPGDHSERRLS